jgi:hypothetical protein
VSELSMTRLMATLGASRERMAVLIRPRFTHRKQREPMTSDDKPQGPISCV